MTRHRSFTRKLWAGLVLLILGSTMLVVAPAGAASDASGNLTCEAVIGELGLTDVVTAKDDHQREAPYEGSAVNGDFVVTYRFEAADPPEAYVVTFASEDLVFGVFVKQAAEKHELSRSAVFPEGTYAGSVFVPVGEFSHVSFCTGTLPTTTTTQEGTTTTTTTEGTTTTTTTEVVTTTTEAVTTTTEAVTTTTEAVTTTTEAVTTTTAVGGDEVTTTTVVTETTPTTAAPTTATPATADEEVMGDVVTRQLPATGTNTGLLTLGGLVMVLLGSVLVAQSSKQLRGDSLAG